MVTYLESDILKCKVRWALGSITTNKGSGDDGIPAELFKILKLEAGQVWHSMSKIWKTQQWSKNLKRSVLILISKKGNEK